MIYKNMYKNMYMFVKYVQNQGIQNLTQKVTEQVMSFLAFLTRVTQFVFALRYSYISLHLSTEIIPDSTLK